MPDGRANPVASRCCGLRQACSIHASVVMATAASAKDNETRAVRPTVLPKSAAERLATSVETNAPARAMATMATLRHPRNASRALPVWCFCPRAGRSLVGNTDAPRPRETDDEQEVTIDSRTNECIQLPQESSQNIGDGQAERPLRVSTGALRNQGRNQPVDSVLLTVRWVFTDALVLSGLQN
jgi:hypothetical protein